MENYKENYCYQDEITLIDLFNILKKHKKVILLFIVGGFILGSILGFIAKPEYKSTLQVRPNKEYIATYDENIEGIVNSYDFREYIVKKNNFEKDYLKLVGVKPQDISDVVYWIDSLAKIDIQSTQINVSGIITVDVSSKDSNFSKRLAMAYYTDLKEYMKLKRSEYYSRKLPYLEEKVKIVGNKITEQNKNLQIMNGRINISALDSSIEKDILAYEEAMGELVEAKMEKLEYRNSISLVKKPKVEKNPSLNKKLIYPIVATILGGVLGVLSAFILKVIEREK